MIAAVGSAALLATALAFEHLGGLDPCPLCEWQRAGHLLALIGAVRTGMGPALIGAFGTGASALTGSWQVGMERGWWSAPDGCAGAPDLSGLSAEAALRLLLMTDPVGCDTVVWSLLGVSMAGWNALLSATLCALWVSTVLTGRRSGTR